MQQRDHCGSFRQSSFDSRIRFAVSNSTTWDPTRVYDCPVGFHWASTEEGYRYFTNSIFGFEQDRFWQSKAGSQSGQRFGLEGYTHVGEVEQSTSLHAPPEPYVYADECGWNGLDWGGVTRRRFRFRDSHLTGAHKHTAHPDSYRPDIDNSFPLTGTLITDDFAGIICIAGDDVSCTTQDCRTLGTGQELWRTDGTVEGTTRLEDINPGPVSSNPMFLTSFNGYLFFSAHTDTDGRELWYTLGTDYSQAAMITGASTKHAIPSTTAGINPGHESSTPTDLTVAGKYMFFAATEPIHGRELWYIQSGLNTLAAYEIDIVAGKESSNPSGFTSSGGSLPVYFSAYSASTGYELWCSHGNHSTTSMVKDIYPGSTSSNPKYLTWYKHALYFQATDGEQGIELWVHHPSTGATQLLKDIRPGAPDSTPSFMTVFQSTLNGQSYLLFSATDGHLTQGEHALNGLGGSQLWRSDGTAAGTHRAFSRTMNDFYFDREALDMNHPASFAVFYNSLYISASYGEHDNIIPRGVVVGGSSPFHSSNVDLMQGNSQLAVIDDVDTHPDDNITVVLTVDQGMIVLAQATNLPPSSHPQLEILIAVRDTYTRVLLSNALTAMGHVVTLVSDAVSAYNAITNRATQVMTSQRLIAAGLTAVDGLTVDETGRIIDRTFDCVIMGLNFHGESDPTSSTYRSPHEWDGFQALRMIRQWELQTAAVQWGGIKSTPANVLHVPIIAVSFIHEVMNAEPESIQAGADKFMELPLTNVFADGAAAGQVVTEITDTGSYRTKATVEKESERAAYDTFASVVAKYLTHRFGGVEIVASLRKDQSLSIVELDALPGLTVGSTVSITGTLSQVNHVLRGGYYYAQQGAFGQVDLVITVHDRPVRCSTGLAATATKQVSAEFSDESSKDMPDESGDDSYNLNAGISKGVYTNSSLSRGVNTQLNGGLVTSSTSYFTGFINTLSDSNHSLLDYTDTSIALCDSTNGSSVVSRYIPIYVVAVNQPPRIMVAATGFSVTVDTITAVPALAMDDADFSKQTLISSFGLNVTAPVSVILTCGVGRLTFPSAYGLVFLQGTGFTDRIVSLTGSYTDINTALQTVWYECRAQDGCFSGFKDTVTVLVDDQGFSGRGGALTATMELTVTIL